MVIYRTIYIYIIRDGGIYIADADIYLYRIIDSRCAVVAYDAIAFILAMHAKQLYS